MAIISFGQNQSVNIPDDLWSKYSAQVQGGADPQQTLHQLYDEFVTRTLQEQGLNREDYGKTWDLSSLGEVGNEIGRLAQAVTAPDTPISRVLVENLKNPNFNFASSNLSDQSSTGTKYPAGITLYDSTGKTIKTDGTTKYDPNVWSTTYVAPKPVSTPDASQNADMIEISPGVFVNKNFANPATIAQAKAYKPDQPALQSLTTSTSNSSTGGINFPNVSLMPGDTGDNVKQLQDYLVSKGLMTQDQVNTGYGTYGPQTQAAVKALQQQLGIDNSSGPGYFGPRTIAALGGSVNAGTTSIATNNNGGGTAYQEGQYVAGKGTVSPDGTFTPTKPGDTGGNVSRSTGGATENPVVAQNTQNTQNTQTNTGQGGTTSATTGGNQNNAPLPDASHPNDQTAQDIINSANIPQDQKDLALTLYEVISRNDQAQADRLKSAFNAATEYSAPYFKAQALIATDALDRTLGANEGDLAYQETKLRNTLNDLTNNTAASKDQLSFQHQQELQKLADSYKQDLQNTHQNLAAVGKTSSSVRSQAEDLLNRQNEGLVESSNRNYSYQTGNLDRTLNSSVLNTNQQLQYLTDKNTQARIDALRTAEQKVGTQGLVDAGYNPMDLLGGQSGTINRQAVTDALSFANSNFVF